MMGLDFLDKNLERLGCFSALGYIFFSVVPYTIAGKHICTDLMLVAFVGLLLRQKIRKIPLGWLSISLYLVLGLALLSALISPCAADSLNQMRKDGLPFLLAFLLLTSKSEWTVGSSPFDTRDLGKQRGTDWIWLEKLLPDVDTGIGFSKVTPAIFFSEAEVNGFKLKFADLPRDYGVIKATVGVNRTNAAELKNLELDGFARVMREFPKISWLQVGDSGKPVVAKSINLLGMTILRELLWTLSQEKILLSVEGFLTHASAAFNVPTVVPFIGAHQPKGLLYP